jgi:FkbM family methyltransferase
MDLQKIITENKIQLKGIIQLGSHWFQERDEFIKLGVTEFVLIEPQKEAFAKLMANCKELQGKINVKAFNCAVSDFEGQAEMNCDTSNQGQSSSLLEPDEHIREYPGIKFDHKEIVNVKLLKNIDFDHSKYNFLVMDLQGNELKALHGAGTLLNHIDCIYTEVNFSNMYKHCVQIKELDEYLHAYGFARTETEHVTPKWGNAFYIKHNNFYSE